MPVRSPVPPHKSHRGTPNNGWAVWGHGDGRGRTEEAFWAREDGMGLVREGMGWDRWRPLPLELMGSEA